MHPRLSRQREKPLGLAELIAIALGGMVGGGIFSILGISVEQIGNATPIAIAIGGGLALAAAYSYVKLALLYKDEGATYSFFKRTFPKSRTASSIIAWLITFGYISTLALYAYTFAAYLGSALGNLDTTWALDSIAAGILLIFVLINIISVRGMGKTEDWMVYSKLVILMFISGMLVGKGSPQKLSPMFAEDLTIPAIVICAAITFVAYEGFQLVIHAYREMDAPQKNIPRSIYSSIVIACILYITLAFGALATIPKEVLIADKEHALAAGAQDILGRAGMGIVIFGALLATSSAISGTLFGASRLMAVIADDGFFPKALGKRVKVHIPRNAVITMAVTAFILIITGGLRLILEFGSITFILVSFLMAWANVKVRHRTGTHIVIAILACIALLLALVAILYYEAVQAPWQLLHIGVIYAIVSIGAVIYSKRAVSIKA